MARRERSATTSSRVLLRSSATRALRDRCRARPTRRSSCWATLAHAPARDGGPRAVEGTGERRHPGHEQLRARRGRLGGGVGDLVGDRGVDLVADPGEHRHRARGDGPGDRLVVEGGQVRAGPAAAHEREHVEPVGGEHADGRRDRSGGVAALHPGVGAQHVEREAAPPQLVEEVGLGRRPLAGDEPDAERGQRERRGRRWRGAGPRRRAGRAARRGRPRAGRACRRGRSPSSGAGAARGASTSRAGPGCARRCRRSCAPRRPPP